MRKTDTLSGKKQLFKNLNTSIMIVCANTWDKFRWHAQTWHPICLNFQQLMCYQEILGTPERKKTPSSFLTNNTPLHTTILTLSLLNVPSFSVVAFQTRDSTYQIHFQNLQLVFFSMYEEFSVAFINVMCAKTPTNNLYIIVNVLTTRCLPRFSIKMPGRERVCEREKISVRICKWLLIHGRQ